MAARKAAPCVRWLWLFFTVLFLPAASAGCPAGRVRQEGAPPQAVTLPELFEEPGQADAVATTKTASDTRTEGDPILYDVPQAFKAQRPAAGGEREEAYVWRVVDGDTLIVLLDGERERLRLLGVDAPESSSNPDEWRRTPEGDAVSALVSDLLTGSTVMLEYDSARRDRFDRLLAYVWLNDETMLNESLVFSGLAEVVRIAPNTAYYRYFKLLEAEAERLGLGFR